MSTYKQAEKRTFVLHIAPSYAIPAEHTKVKNKVSS